MTDAAARQMKAIHASRRKVPGLEEDADWRAFLTGITGKASLKLMSSPELGRVLDRLHGKGAPKRSQSRALDDRPQARLVRAMWITLHQLGEVVDAGEGALGRFVERQTGAAALQWCDEFQLRSVVEALKEWCGRVGYKVNRLTSDDASYTYRVLEAQWAELTRLTGDNGTLDARLLTAMVEIPQGGTGQPQPYLANPRQLAPIVEQLGHKLRALKQPAKPADTSGGGDG